MGGKHLLSVLLLILYSCGSHAQQEDITAKTSFWNGTKYYQSDERLTKTEVMNHLVTNQEALNLFKKGTGSQTASTVLGSIGGFLIGWPIGGAIAGQENPNWTLAAVGTGLVVIGIPIYSGGSKKINSALDLYNQKLSRTFAPDRSPPSVSVVINQMNFGLKICF